MQQLPSLTHKIIILYGMDNWDLKFKRSSSKLHLDKICIIFIVPIVIIYL